MSHLTLSVERERLDAGSVSTQSTTLTISSKETAVKTIHALVIHTDNTTERIEVLETEFPNALHKAIGDWFTHVSINTELDFWVDDAGLLKGLPINKVATQFYAQMGATTPIVGTAVFTGGSTPTGYTKSLDDAYAKALEFAAKMANEF